MDQRAADTAKARDLLREVLEWWLTADDWSVVEQALDALSRSWVQGDIGSFRCAVTDLELTDRVRATRIGEPPLTAAPEQIRERIVVLVHSLEGSPPASPASGSDTNHADA